MRPRLLLVCLLISCIFPILASAQDQKKDPNEGKAPKFVMISSTQLNTAKAVNYDKLLARFRKVADESHANVTWIAAAPMTGDGTHMTYLTFPNSFAEVEQQMTAFETLGKEVTVKDTALTNDFAAAEVGYRTELMRFRPKLSFHPDALDPAHTTRWMVVRYNLKPGASTRFADLVKEVIDIYQGVPGTDAHWIAYSSVAGGKPAMMMVVPMKTLAEMDQENPAEDKAFTKTIIAHLDATLGELVTSVETNIYMARPELSRPPQSFLEENAAFWTPKPMEATTPPPGKKKTPKMEAEKR